MDIMELQVFPWRLLLAISDSVEETVAKADIFTHVDMLKLFSDLVVTYTEHFLKLDNCTLNYPSR